MIIQRAAKEFTDIYTRVYADIPYNITEDSNQVLTSLSMDNQYFDKNQGWMNANENARLAAFFIPELAEIEGKRAAFFGFWESLPDSKDDNLALFNEAEEWAKVQGAEVIFGPLNFHTAHNYRLKLDNFNSHQFPGEPYNPPYYEGMLKSLGYEQHHGYSTVTAAFPPMDEETTAKWKKSSKTAAENGLTITNLTLEMWQSRAEEFYSLICAIFANNFAFAGITRPEFFEGIAPSIGRTLCPKSSLVALDNDKVAAFFICIPDYGKWQIDHPNEKFEYSKHINQIEPPVHLLAKTVGTLPEYRGSGLFGLMGGTFYQNAPSLYGTISGAMFRDGNNSGKIAANYLINGDSTSIRRYGLFNKIL